MSSSDDASSRASFTSKKRTRGDSTRQSSSSSRAVSKKSKTTTKALEKLKGAKFRWLNETLYTSTGSSSFDLFTKDPHLFELYHEGFTSQVRKWPVNPVNVLADRISSKKNASELVVGDFGCGDAKLADELYGVVKKIHSFDLVDPSAVGVGPKNPNVVVTSCNVAKTPLKNAVLDVGVFCLSLMGTDYYDFLLEANRTVKVGGIVYVVEVKSRFAPHDRESDKGSFQTKASLKGLSGVPQSKVNVADRMKRGLADFAKEMKLFGFRQTKRDTSNTMFVLFGFKKVESIDKKTSKELKKKSRQVKKTALEPCLYKLR